MVIQLISFILISIITVVVLIDIIPLFRDWLGRIHIGRTMSENKWNHLITNIGIKWLNKTPKIKVTDNTRWIIIDILRGNYTRNAIQSWQEAALLLGVVEYLKNHNDEKIKKEVEKYVNNKFNEKGQWINSPEHIDSAILAYAIMKMDSTNIDKYKAALDFTWDLIQEHIGEDGTVGYRKSMKSYRYVDTIGFICPFLIAYGHRYGKAECIELAVRQIKQYEKYAMLDKHYIPSHAYKVENKTPAGLYGWGRGLGWYAIGLIDSWDELPKDSLYKPVLEVYVRKFAKAALYFQQENGSWNWKVTLDEARPDSSATATLCWFLLNASKIEEISQECLAGADKSIHYLMKVTRKNGMVDFSQGDTKGLGVYSNLFNILPFTQGFCLRCINRQFNNRAAPW